MASASGSSGYYLGIDLGTTFTAAAVLRDGRAQIASLGNRTAAIPSLIFVHEDQTILIGETAERRGLAEPHRLAREFKRRVGDTAPIMLGQAPYSAERLLALLVRKVVAEVSEREGSPPRAVTISHPANWGPFKVDLMRHGVELAGLRNVTLVTEPVAAAVHYTSTNRVEVGAAVAVYDLGGGTFDAAVLRKTPDGFVTMGEPEGIERLGGIDFDDAVLAHVRQALGDQLDGLNRRDPAVRSALARLRQECIAAKEALSADTDTTISVALPGVQTDIRLTRAEFEPMARPAIAETIEALRRALERSSIIADDLAAVVVVGGSSRIPLVAEMISAAIGRPVALDVHPKHAVALGASLMAGLAGDQTGVQAAAPDPPRSDVDRPPAPAPAPPPRPPAPVAEQLPPSPPPAPPPPAPAKPKEPEKAPEPVPATRLIPAGALSGGKGRGRGNGRDGRNGGDGQGNGKRRRAMVGGAAAVLAVVLGVGGFALTSRSDGGTSADAAECSSASGRCTAITNISVEEGRYAADYTTTGFDPLIFLEGQQGTPEDHHVHFFFNTTSPSNAGTNGNPPGQWTIWDRPSGGGDLHFAGVPVSERGEASELCVAVADSNHAVEADSGNCVALP